MKIALTQTIFERIKGYIKKKADISEFNVFCYDNIDSIVFISINIKTYEAFCHLSSLTNDLLCFKGVLTVSIETIENITLSHLISLIEIKKKGSDILNYDDYRFFGRIEVERYLYSSNNIGRIILQQTLIGQFNELTCDLELSMDCAFQDTLLLFLKENLLFPSLKKQDLLHLLRNDCSYYSLCQSSLIDIFNEIKKEGNDCKYYKIYGIGSTFFSIKSNIDGFEEVIEKYFDNYAFIELVSGIKDIDIFFIKNDMIRFKLWCLLQNMEYVNRFKIINHPIIITRGEDHIFFDVDNKYIIGSTTYYGPIDNESVYYIYDRNCDLWYQFISENNEKMVQAAPRMIRMLTPYYVEKKEGFNFHAASVVWKDEKSVLIMGDKYQGKTTNMFCALSTLDEMNYQSNDYVSVITTDKGVITYGSPIPIGIRIGTILLNSSFKQKIMNYQFMKDLRSMKNGYGYQCLFLEENGNNQINNYFGEFAISFTPREFVTLINKEIKECAVLFALIQPVFDNSISSFQIIEMDNEMKFEMLMRNQHNYYNAIEPFWNKVLNYYENINRAEMSNKLEVISKNVPGYIIKSNKDNIISAWAYFEKEYLNKSSR